MWACVRVGVPEDRYISQWTTKSKQLINQYVISIYECVNANKVSGSKIRRGLTTSVTCGEETRLFSPASYQLFLSLSDGCTCIDEFFRESRVPSDDCACRKMIPPHRVRSQFHSASLILIMSFARAIIRNTLRQRYIFFYERDTSLFIRTGFHRIASLIIELSVVKIRKKKRKKKHAARTMHLIDIGARG